MDNCVCTGRVSGLQGAPASVASPCQQPPPATLLPSSNKPQQPTNQCTLNLPGQNRSVEWHQFPKFNIIFSEKKFPLKSLFLNAD